MLGEKREIITPARAGPPGAPLSWRDHALEFGGQALGLSCHWNILGGGSQQSRKTKLPRQELEFSQRQPACRYYLGIRLLTRAKVDIIVHIARTEKSRVVREILKVIDFDRRNQAYNMEPAA
jgi:hypothetical protein